ncbi:MAG: J domain-containing protein [Sphingomonadales bacterium]
MPGEYKDHYQTLGLAPGATAAQIKKSWRKLVLDLHPDKTGNDPALAIRFREIQQAYEVLSDPLQKIQFLQERWLRKAQGQTTHSDVVDLASWVKECLVIEKKATTQDPERIDQPRLQAQIEELIADQKMATMRSYADPEALITGARLLLQAAYGLSFKQWQAVAKQLAKIEPNHHGWQLEIKKAEQQKKRDKDWERYRLLAVLLLTLLLTLLIAS